MAILITLVLFLILVMIITYLGYRYYARPGRLYQQLGGQAAFTMPGVDQIGAEEPGLVVSIIEQIGEKMPSNPADDTMIRRDLVAAGYRSEKALPIYLGIRIVCCVFF